MMSGYEPMMSGYDSSSGTAIGRSGLNVHVVAHFLEVMCGEK